MIRIFCKSSSNNASGVIRALEELEGINTSNYTGDGEGFYYYIDEDMSICCTADNIFKKLLEQNFREIGPSTNFKRGDILISDISKSIVIFDKYTTEKKKFRGYLLFSNSSIFSGLKEDDWITSIFHIASSSELNSINMAVYKTLTDDKED